VDRFADELLRESAAMRERSCRLRAQSLVLHQKSKLLIEQAEALYLGTDMAGGQPPRPTSLQSPRNRALLA
jgi:hypothetical protein